MAENWDRNGRGHVRRRERFKHSSGDGHVRRRKRVKHSSGNGRVGREKHINLLFGSAANMVATSLDSRDMIKMNYSRSAVDNLEKIEDFGGTVLHEVNAHTMSKHPILRRKSFDRIVYNFPHAGFYGPEESLLQIELHRDLVRGLKNAKTMLTEDGVIHVTHKTAHPYSKWEIEKLAEEQGLFLVEKVRFSVRDYKGYVNRRGKSPNCYSTFRIGEASTYKFSKNDHGIHRDNTSC
ncbi:hypothetical protein ACJRO7_023848 [Eucalyptus globulus]|uniref:25S rRNA (uridine-N(3))-methyltransferase BMT5-like domain-containing protein n=1 Tax=Eucalyptus globulus TaxID=34317 RepID=A0ABD3KCD8_EUCGL